MKPRKFFSMCPTDEDWRLFRLYSEQTGLSLSDLIRKSVRLAGPALVQALQAASRAVTVAATQEGKRCGP